MSERRKQFPFPEFEPKWQLLWQERQTFHAPNPYESGFDPAKPKFYVLDMFPYPSGEGLHVGHLEGYTATDIIARYKRMKGFNVLHPMGWDAFGLPAEQFAIKTGLHPSVATARNIDRFKSQLSKIGFSYDWNTRSQYDRSRLLQVDSVDFFEIVQFLVRSRNEGSPTNRRTHGGEKHWNSRMNRQMNAAPSSMDIAWPTSRKLR